MSKILILAVSLLLSACSMPLNQSSEQDFKSLGVVSLVSGNAAVARYGLTVFNNDFATLALDPDLNQTVEGEVAQASASRVRSGWSNRSPPTAVRSSRR